MHWKQKQLVFELDVCAIGTQRLDIVNAVAFPYKYVPQDAGLSRCLIQPQHQVNKNLFLESEHAVETKAVGVSKHNPFGQVCCSISKHHVSRSECCIVAKHNPLANVCCNVSKRN